MLEKVKEFFINNKKVSFLRIKISIYTIIFLILIFIARAIYYKYSFVFWQFLLVSVLAIIFGTVVIGEKIVALIINYIKKKFYS